MKKLEVTGLKFQVGDGRDRSGESGREREKMSKGRMDSAPALFSSLASFSAIQPRSQVEVWRVFGIREWKAYGTHRRLGKKTFISTHSKGEACDFA